MRLRQVAGLAALLRVSFLELLFHCVAPAPSGFRPRYGGVAEVSVGHAVVATVAGVALAGLAVHALIQLVSPAATAKAPPLSRGRELLLLPHQQSSFFLAEGGSSGRLW